MVSCIPALFRYLARSFFAASGGRSGQRHMSSALIADLQARGLIFQLAGEDALPGWLDGGVRSLYCGFDPTADSLHIGSLVPLLALRRFQLAGHRPIALVGGATGLIGDPSFKAQERQLNTPEVIAGWVGKLEQQVARFVDFDAGPQAATVVNNLDWTARFSVLDFLRDVGKHFAVNAMIQKESVRQRLDREGAGISYTEFSYMILQALDFAELAKRYDCSLQLGGSDQWGNITAGIDLTRRLHGRQVYGLTLPLITKADGTKFGKTESGTVWLDPARTSPYAFYQFWLGTADADVYRFLRYFTFLDVADIDALERADGERPGRPEAQGVLAREVTRLVHGEAGLAAAERISESLFAGDPAALGAGDFAQLRLDGLPASALDRGALPETLTQTLVEAGMAKSGKQVKDALGSGAVQVNGRPLAWEDNAAPAACFAPERALHERFYLVRLGKKKYHLFEAAGAVSPAP
jgi:tyrosyl-tRNA synthetase